MQPSKTPFQQTALWQLWNDQKLALKVTETPVSQLDAHPETAAVKKALTRDLGA